MERAIAALSVLLTACSYPVDELDRLPQPTGDLALVKSEPSAGEQDVPRNEPIDLFFAVPIAAERLEYDQIQLFAGRLRLAVSLSTDLLERRVRITPSNLLRPELRHQVRISADLRGLDGSTLGDEPQTFEFTTGTSTAELVPTGLLLVTAEDLQPLWNRRCVGCHGRAGRAGVDLSSPKSAIASLRNVASQGSTLLRVRPGDHARSYLLRKLLGGPGIIGYRMPPEGAPVTTDQLRDVAAWIDGGAR